MTSALPTPPPLPCLAQGQLRRIHHLALNVIAYRPVTRPTGRGVYFYDPDGFMVEIRCDPTNPQTI